MEYRIEELETFKIVGYKIHSTNAFMKGIRDCSMFWKKIIKENKNELYACSKQYKKGSFI